MKSASDQLKETFGYSEFLPGQAAAIDKLLAGSSTLVVFPTGGGKSLCYQLPALMLDGLTLVVSPLIALMKDQVDDLVKRGVAAARLDSTLTGDEVKQIYRDIERGELSILYVAPERLANERFLRRLAQTQIALLAVDEAHCISEWGHNFRPDYLKLAGLASKLRVGRVLALTATATPKVSKDICAAFGISPDNHVQTGFFRPNLALSVTPCAADDRLRVLRDKLSRTGATIVYVTQQKTAEWIASQLAEAGFAARAYHAGMKSDRRAEVQDEFMSGRSQIVVATIAFGMGIDKSDIRAIFHFNLPKSLEGYAQEIGRAGRDGEPATCEILGCADDTVVLENFTFGDTPDPAAVHGLVEELTSAGERFSISRYDLSDRYDMRPLVVATALTRLELDGVIELEGPFYSTYKFRPLSDLDSIAASFGADRAAFLRSVFDASKKGRTWFTLDPTAAAESLGEPEQRIRAAIDYLDQKGQLEVRVSGLRHRYRRGRNATPASELADGLVATFSERETRDVERSKSIVAFAENEGCLAKALNGHFGEDIGADCGQCTSCISPGPRTLPRLPRKAPSESAERRVRELTAEGHRALASHRQLARFLVGLKSPATSRAKLSRHDAFGCMASVPFVDVLAFVEQTRNA